MYFLYVRVALQSFIHDFICGDEDKKMWLDSLSLTASFFTSSHSS